MKLVRIKPIKCTACGFTYEVAGDPTNLRAAPKPGQLALCLGCGELMIFDENLQMVTAPPERIARLREIDPSIYDRLLAVQASVRKQNQVQQN